MDWGGKGVVNFNSEKTQLVSFGHSNNSAAMGVKMDRSSFMQNHLFR